MGGPRYVLGSPFGCVPKGGSLNGGSCSSNPPGPKTLPKAIPVCSVSWRAAFAATYHYSDIAPAHSFAAAAAAGDLPA